ncbi:MAG: hypothetical protein M0R30_03695 [Methanoregula sp.]|jgi:hypothetical protein|uniref:hypothetical protein n=1 Tax=Methanoregula sp. TaxID=2052170 RepID=UPI0025DCFBC9|nr:hypothetical protein [Methanoregula sp.]MCK9630723.1 hypothetical protein [Methanoregula sp.]
MTLLRVSEIIYEWTGWCPNSPALRTAPAVLRIPPETMHGDRPEGRGPASRSGSVRLGTHIAVDSLKTMARNRYLLGLSLLSGLAMFFLIVAKMWDVQHFHDTLPFLVTISSGSTSIVFDPWLFVVELICLSCFIFVLADMVLHRNGDRENTPIMVHEGFSGTVAYAAPLALLSNGMALIATIAFEILYKGEFFTDMIVARILAVFTIPNTYLPYGDVMAFYITYILLFINIILFLAALWLVPAIVLKLKARVPDHGGSMTLIQKTWREVLGCILVGGTIVIGVIAIAFAVSQLPYMLHYEYDATASGHPLIMVVYYGFILACMVLMAAGFTAAGVAVEELNRIQTSNEVSGNTDGNREKQ